MNKGHLKSGEVIDLGTLGEDMKAKATYALIRTEAMEVIRMVIPEGRTIAEHSVEGEITVQCLKGTVEFAIENTVRHLSTDDWLHLDKKEPHALTAQEDTVLLLTILFTSPEENNS
jgi:quercetin dioxygenase-like cupin family protein